MSPTWRYEGVPSYLGETSPSAGERARALAFITQVTADATYRDMVTPIGMLIRYPSWGERERQAIAARQLRRRIPAAIRGTIWRVRVSVACPIWHLAVLLDPSLRYENDA